MLNTIKDDILRAYRVLGAEKAYCQNWLDIHDWKKQGYLTQEQEQLMLSFNKTQYEKEANAIAE